MLWTHKIDKICIKHAFFVSKSAAYKIEQYFLIHCIPLTKKKQESKFTVSKDFLHVGLALTSSLQTTYLFSKKVDKGDIKPFQIKMTAARCI